MDKEEYERNLRACKDCPHAENCKIQRPRQYKNTIYFFGCARRDESRAKNEGVIE